MHVKAHAVAGRSDKALGEFRDLWMRHPSHPLAARARQRVIELAGESAAALSAVDRIARADRLTRDKWWREAVLELDQIGDDIPVDVRRKRDFELGRTLFKMRRQYKLAGDLLLSVYRSMGADPAGAEADETRHSLTWAEAIQYRKLNRATG